MQEAAAATEGFWQIPDAAINLGHVHVAAGQPGAAIQAYSNALKRHPQARTPQLLTYLARCAGPR